MKSKASSKFSNLSAALACANPGITSSKVCMELLPVCDAKRCKLIFFPSAIFIDSLASGSKFFTAFADCPQAGAGVPPVASDVCYY